jgi:hypothetical protein
VVVVLLLPIYKTGSRGGREGKVKEIKEVREVGEAGVNNNLFRC